MRQVLGFRAGLNAREKVINVGVKPKTVVRAAVERAATRVVPAYRNARIPLA